LKTKILSKIVTLPIRVKQLILILIDSVVLIPIILASFSLRLGLIYWPDDSLIWVILVSPLIAIPIFIRFGLYRAVIRYIGLKALWAVFQAVTIYSCVWGLAGYMITQEWFTHVLPRSVIVLNWLFTLIVILGFRSFATWILTNVENEKAIKAVVFGAGYAGRQLSIALKTSREYKPIFFVDDDKKIIGRFINGIEVLSREEFEKHNQKQQIDEVLLAIPSVSKNKKKDIIGFLESLKVTRIRSLPSVSKLAMGDIKIDDLQPIDINDLLGRLPVKPNVHLLTINIQEKVVLVTGAGGSIGSELCRQIITLKPEKLVLYEISEAALYKIEQELSQNLTLKNKIYPILGSVLDKKRFTKICTKFGVETIYHSAAYKHVPLVEFNQEQGVLNNSIGTMRAAEAAIASKAETFVLISTDKAVRPSSTMGASKRVSELILQAFSKQNNTTNFTMVRFGNVIDSSGSVIPLFKKQIKDGGPITVTDSNIVRYFMTIPEAVELVIQAGAMGQGGDVFVLDMGDPIKIYDLAVKMVQLSGLRICDENNPNGDIEIKYTGLRPGEKLYEELLVGDNSFQTENKLILRASEGMLSWEELEPLIADLEAAIKDSNQFLIREVLRKIVPEFQPQSKIIDYLFEDSNSII
jgi:FlaA1/EpsC-like NDP-sugar epimerase